MRPKLRVVDIRGSFADVLDTLQRVNGVRATQDAGGKHDGKSVGWHPVGLLLQCNPVQQHYKELVSTSLTRDRGGCESPAGKNKEVRPNRVKLIKKILRQILFPNLIFRVRLTVFSVDLTHISPDQMENEALQCAQVCPAQLVDDRVHPSDHLPLVWLTWIETETHKKNHRRDQRKPCINSSAVPSFGKWRNYCGDVTNSLITHGSQEFLVQFKGHQRAGQVPQPLFENTGNDVDVVVVQIHTVHIWEHRDRVGLVTVNWKAVVYLISVLKQNVAQKNMQTEKKKTNKNSISPVSRPWRSSLILLVEPDFL